MMNVTWIIQTNMGSASDIGQYVQAVKNSGANVIEVEHIPFSDEVPKIKVNGPIVVYGATSFISACSKDKILSKGIFGDSETLTYQNWAQHYNEMLLNSPDVVQLMTVGDFSEKAIKDDEELIFVRPQHDTKSLVGKVWTAKDFKQWCDVASTNVFAGVSKDTPIVVGKTFGIDAEWRLVVVDGEVVTASQYYKRGKLFKERGAPDEVIQFANDVIARWNPLPAYIIDICKSAGNCYIMEVQGFNSAGTYFCDMEKVARKLNDFLLKQHKELKIKL